MSADMQAMAPASRLEPLEPRLLLAADVVISEIMYHPYAASHQPEPLGEEFIELHNRGDAAADLSGWKFTDGVSFEFPDVALAPGGYLVVPADPGAFHARYPTVTNYIAGGGWDGRLSDSGEEIELVDADGRLVDRVLYAEQGDWAVRAEGPSDDGHTGWVWSADHDGGGKSLEVIQPALTNDRGQNWAASLVNGGTPGRANSVAAADIAPLVRDVTHAPAVPTSADPVTVRACIEDAPGSALTVRLYHREDGDPDFDELAMHDDGLHGDGRAGDGVYAATIAPTADGTVVEFYVGAADATGNSRTWPAPAAGHGQVVNALYQVDDSFDPDATWASGSQPQFRLVMTEAERAELAYIGSHSSDAGSDAQMNATFLVTDGAGTHVRYLAGIRNRGHGSRTRQPNNHRVILPHDAQWEGVSALNLNGQYTWLRVVGSAIFRRSGLPAADARPARVLVNGHDPTQGTTASRTYGSYVHAEVVDSDFAAGHFPDDASGNVYKCMRISGEADLGYDGPDPGAYRTNYLKKTNYYDQDYSDLIELTHVLSEAPDDVYVEEVERVIDADQWLRFFALSALIDNNETNISRGEGDDYYLYRGMEDTRFVIVPHDLDTILGQGNNPGSATASIFRATGVATIDRFLTHPAFLPRYYAQLRDLIETTFSPEQIGPLLENLLGSYVPADRIEAMKAFVAARNQHVLSLIPAELSVGTDLPVQSGYPRTDGGAFELSGQSDAVRTRTVTVNGRLGEWDPAGSQWSFDSADSGFESRQLVAADAPVAYHVPTDLDDLEDWTALGFNDDGWVQSITLDGSGVVLTEIATGETRFVEVQNVSAGAVATTGWSVLVNDASGGINAVNGVGWSLPASLGPGEVLYRTDDPSDNYWQATIDWGAEGPGWAMIVDGAGDVTDFLAWGYTAAEIASLSIDYGAFSGITVGDQWSGDGAAVGTIEEAVAAGGWVAFNDHIAGAGTHAHATTYAANGMASGLLKDISTGANLGATLTITENGTSYEGTQGLPAAGTDAFDTFDGYVDFGSGTGSSLALTGTDHYTHTFSGLDAGDAAIYNFAGTAVRGGTDYADRWTLVRLSGADAATPAHSSGAGVVVLSATQVALWTGENQQADQGFIAAWTDIDPGADGEFSVIASQYTGPTPGVGDGMAGNESPTKAYGLTGIRLEEVSDTPPPPPPEGWVAYNDHLAGPGTHANTTLYSTGSGQTDAGPLRNIADGTDTGAWLEVTAAGVHYGGEQGSPAPGTDAYDVFQGYVDLSASSGSGASLEVAGADHYTYTLSQLDTGDVVTYTFHGTAIRGEDGYTNRWTRVALEGAEAGTAAHSSGDGVIVISPTEVAIWTGENHQADQGFVTAWTEIDPGADGEFSVVCRQYTGTIPTTVDAGGTADGSKGYGISGIRLEEVRPSGPQSWLKRKGSTDVNTAGDFARDTTDSKGAQNAAMAVPFGTVIPTLQGVGFHSDQPAFAAVIQTGVAEAMEGVNASLWTRIAFEAPDVSAFEKLLLRVKYDDGFLAYLNGEEVARRNADNPPAWNTAASAEHDDDLAVEFEEIDVSEFLNLVHAGQNVLAVHALNVAADDADLLLQAELLATRGDPSDLVLRPGINRLLVRAFDGDGREIDRETIDIWYDDGDVQDVSGTLAEATWRAVDGPFRVTGDVTVPAGETLTIEPGTTVFFDAGTRMTVRGRLVAEGTETNRIFLTRPIGSSSTWDGLFFDHSLNDSRLTYADMDYASGANQAIDVAYSQLLLDHVTWGALSHEVIEVHHPSLIVRNSVFPGISSGEVIHGTDMSGDEYFILDGNVFHYCTSGGDVIDFLGADRPGPVFEVRNNVFLGGGDDGVDLDGTDAHIEGNVFMNFHLSTGRTTTAQAIATGEPQSGESIRTEITVVGNVFYDMDHAILLKEDAFLTAVNNVFIGATEAAIQFNEEGGTGVHGPGKGAYLDGNIFWNNAAVFKHLTDEIELAVHHSILPSEFLDRGDGNLDADPLFVDDEGDFHLRPGSPAVGTGPNGLDMGRYVPAGASLSGEPDAVTNRIAATLTVGGPDIFAYKYRVNGGPWSAEVPRPGAGLPGTDIQPLDPIELAGLADGTYTVEVLAKDSAERWQGDDDASVSRAWTVDTSHRALVINEVLAHNVQALDHEGTRPDVVELHYDGPAPVSLAGMVLTDDPDDAERSFVFPPGSEMQPGDHLILYADAPEPPTPGMHLGFALDAEGDGLHLYGAPGEGEPLGELIDSIAFGIQLPDLSIGRVGPNAEWALTQPTFGGENVAQPTASPAGLKINEWLAFGEVVLEDDFVEIYNPEPVPVPLGGLFLTDHPATRPARYEIPALSFIAGEGFSAFVADDDPRAGADHASFRLAADQEMIALFDADGSEIDWVLFTAQGADVSQGRRPDGADPFGFFALPTPGVANVRSGAVGTTTQTLVAETAPKWALVPTADIGTEWRSDYVHDTSGWHDWDGTPGGVGYDSGSGDRYRPLIGLDVEAEMDDTHATCYVRIPFPFDGDPADVTQLTLRIRYDDAFVAYLNGEEIRRDVFTGEARWDSEAGDDHPDGDAEGLVSFDVSDFIDDWLYAGENLLAIHGLNNGAGSTDFLISAELVATVATHEEDPFSNLLALHEDLRVSELMYNPSGPDSTEFIELQNTGSKELDLTGVRFRGGIEYVFPEVTLGPGEYVAVARDLASLRDWHGADIHAVGGYDPMGLRNAGETIVLQMPEPYEAAILRFAYDDDWHPSTDGDGPSLVVRDALAHRRRWGDGDAWRASSIEGGSPGAIDPAPELPIGAVVVNEVLAHSDGGVEDWIELHNTTGDDIDISGWFLSDDPTDIEKFVVPGDPGSPFAEGNTILPTDGYVAFSELEDFGPGVDPVHGFALSEHGDEVILAACDIDGQLGTYRDYAAFGASAVGVTFGRHTTSTGNVDFVALAEPTYEAGNAAPRLGPIVIEEIMYHPGEGDGEVEYVLLHNIGGEEVLLFDPANPENTWRLGDGIQFAFPQDVRVPADGYVVVAGVGAATYQTSHGVPGGTQVFGPFTGALSNRGETILLARPGVPETLPEPFVPYITVDSVKYNDRAPWPAEADGDGPSLRRAEAPAYGSDPSHWASSPAPEYLGWSLDAPSGLLQPTVTFRFSESVYFDEADVSVLDAAGDPVQTAYALAGSGTEAIVVSFDEPLPYGGPYTVAFANPGVGDLSGRVPAGGQPGATFAVAIDGDADLDRRVGASDYLQVKVHYRQVGVGWTGGDFDDDGIVTRGDFLALRASFGNVYPEPATLAEAEHAPAGDGATDAGVSPPPPAGPPPAPASPLEPASLPTDAEDVAPTAQRPDPAGSEVAPAADAASLLPAAPDPADPVDALALATEAGQTERSREGPPVGSAILAAPLVDVLADDRLTTATLVYP